MEGDVIARRLVLALAAVVACSCSAPPPVGGQIPPSQRTSGALPGDTVAGLVPPGFGTLRQDDIAIKLQLDAVLVKLFPLDESVIRVLSPDSYIILRDLLESRRNQVNRLGALHNLRERNVWYVTFFGLAPDARFIPTDVTLNVAGRDFRPLEILPLSSGFGTQQLSPRTTQSALYLFDDGLDISQPITVRMGTQQNSDWPTILRTIDRERALVRSRAAKNRSTP
jgi:hypothetical protein